MYADGTIIFSSNENRLKLLDDLIMEVDGIMDWLKQNKLSLNIANCEYTFLGKQLSIISEIGKGLFNNYVMLKFPFLNHPPPEHHVLSRFFTRCPFVASHVQLQEEQ